MSQTLCEHVAGLRKYDLLLNCIYRELPIRKSMFSGELPVVNLWRSRGICNTVFPAGLQGLQGLGKSGLRPAVSFTKASQLKSSFAIFTFV